MENNKNNNRTNINSSINNNNNVEKTNNIQRSPRGDHFSVETAADFGITNYETLMNSDSVANDDGSVNTKVLRKMMGAYKLTKEG